MLSDAALTLQQQSRGVDAVRRGILPRLFPDDFAARTQVIDSYPDTRLPVLGATHDLLRDGSVLLLPLRGHARGQIGALVRTVRGDVLLVPTAPGRRRPIASSGRHTG